MIKQFILKLLVNLFIWLCKILQGNLIDLNKLVADLNKLESQTIKTIDILNYVKNKEKDEVLKGEK